MIGALLENIIPTHLELTQMAMRAFARSASLMDKVFANEVYKSFIMTKIFEGSAIDDEEVLKSCMEALNDISKACYDYLD
jgi:hypothetical protein